MYRLDNVVPKGPTPGADALDAVLDVGGPPPVTEVRSVVTDGGQVHIVDGILSSAECEALIHCSEKVGFSFWANQPTGMASTQEDQLRQFRAADTIEGDFPILASLLTQRLQRALPLPPICVDRATDSEAVPFSEETKGEWFPVGLSPNLLFARYGKGGHFAPHVDGSNAATFNRRSFWSVVIYLSAVEGGGTNILRGSQCDVTHMSQHGRWEAKDGSAVAVIEAIPGRAAIFGANVLHEGVAVGGEALKYIVRGDIWFDRRPAICDTPKDHEAYKWYLVARASELSDPQAAVEAYRRVKRLSPMMAEALAL